MTVRILSVGVLLLGALFFALGVAICAGWISSGWGFPLSPVPNWGRPWGVVLLLFGAAYLVAPAVLWVRPETGHLVMVAVGGLSLLLATPVIESAFEIVGNFFRDTPRRPDWVDAAWALTMMLLAALIVALTTAAGSDDRSE